ncbi:MAG: aldose epimerase family protein [Christensenellales bacterium]|jgi:aldose 1-epimerase
MITQRPFGENATLYIITNASGASVSVTDFGGAITSLRVPDKAGKMAEVVLGYSDISGYFPNNDGNLGALIGRVGNRIGGADAVIAGHHFPLEANDNGINSLHSGKSGLHLKFWHVKPIEEANALELTASCADGEGGFPGNIDFKVTYIWDDDCALSIRYEAVSDRDTLCNLTNHAYFNLDGEDSGSIEDHTIQILADAITAVDKFLIPTGEIRDVTGTPFDLRKGKRIGDGLRAVPQDEQMAFGGGYDHNFCLNGSGMRKIAVLTGASGRTMEVYTDLPGVQFYSGNMLSRSEKSIGGRQYQKHDGLCLETQVWPDACHHEHFPQCLLKKGEKYDTTTKYVFGNL